MMVMNTSPSKTWLPIAKNEPTNCEFNELVDPGNREAVECKMTECSEINAENRATNVNSLSRDDSDNQHSSNDMNKKIDDERNEIQIFPCSLCGIDFKNKDQLKQHMVEIHKQKGKHSSESLEPAFDDNKYTCTICSAKFKTFKSYVNHANVHTNKRSRENLDSATLSILHKFTFHDYIQATYGDVGQQLQAVFVCQFCGTTFTSRDSYAMHTMMRVKNDTCRGPNPIPEQQNTGSKLKDENSTPSSRIESESSLSSHGATEHFQQAYFEEVTGKADEDEYLQSLVGKILSSDTKYTNAVHRLNATGPSNVTSKVCMFCGYTSSDQDTLAMHVMSLHSQDTQFAKSDMSPTQGTVRTANAKGYVDVAKTSPAETPFDILSCNQCGEAFACRDSLAMHVLIHERHEETEVAPTISSAVDLSKKRTNASDVLIERDKAKRRKYAPLKETPNCIAGENTEDLYTKAKVKIAMQKTSCLGAFKQPQFNCQICFETFYYEYELAWHYKVRHSSITEQPLCLKLERDGILNSDKKELDWNIPMKTVSRSRSLSEERIPTLLSPKRPFSAGQIDQLGFGRVPLKDELVSFNEETTKIFERKGMKFWHESGTTLVRDSENRNSSQNEKTTSDGVGEETKSLGDYDVCHPSDVQMGMEEMSITPKETFDHEKSVDDITNLIKSESETFQILLRKRNEAMVCKFCEIIFFNKTVYHLHMGLHNVNNPWQCNICGLVCSGVHDFSAHVIHC